MHKTIQTIKTALAHAKFENPDIESGVTDLVTELGNDLDGDEVSYIPGLRVDNAESALLDTLNDADEEAEEVVIPDAEDDDDDVEDGE